MTLKLTLFVHCQTSHIYLIDRIYCQNGRVTILTARKREEPGVSAWAWCLPWLSTFPSWRRPAASNLHSPGKEIKLWISLFFRHRGFSIAWEILPVLPGLWQFSKWCHKLYARAQNALHEKQDTKIWICDFADAFLAQFPKAVTLWNATRPRFSYRNPSRPWWLVCLVSPVFKAERFTLCGQTRRLWSRSPWKRGRWSGPDVYTDEGKGSQKGCLSEEKEMTWEGIWGKSFSARTGCGRRRRRRKRETKLFQFSPKSNFPHAKALQMPCA